MSIEAGSFGLNAPCPDRDWEQAGDAVSTTTVSDGEIRDCSCAREIDGDPRVS
jgi:hypothetical protein